MLNVKDLVSVTHEMPYEIELLNEKGEQLRYDYFLSYFCLTGEKRCCSGKSVLPPTRTFSSSQHVFDRNRPIYLLELL